jgi:acetyl esterase
MHCDSGFDAFRGGMKNITVLVCSVFFAAVYASSVVAEPRFLRSTYDLEDPSGYCLDIPGFGPRMRKDAPIGTHTCKYSIPGFYVDELFELTSVNYLRLPEFDLCLAAQTMAVGSHINTIACELDNVHAWSMGADGNVTPEGNSELCLTMSHEKVYVNTSVANLTPNSGRAVSLQTCDSNNHEYQSWKLSDPHELKTETANTLRSGMGIEAAKIIRELGNEIRPQETEEIYANQPRMFSVGDVNITDEIAYGEEQGQQLQVYTGINRHNPQRGAPVILLVHGGGFRFGDLNSFASTATHFAGLGYVVVNMTYPMAPNANWPSGGLSVASAIRWITENAADIKGDPNGIFVLGHSAGGTHVADYVFRSEIYEEGNSEIAGAIISSPVLAVTDFLSGASYYGDNASEWPNQQILGNVDRSSVPVLILTAELDPVPFQVSAVKLLNELVVENGAKAARFSQLAGHNHISYISSIGTSDTQSAEQIIDFIAATVRN